jgi:hypothetical protein
LRGHAIFSENKSLLARPHKIFSKPLYLYFRVVHWLTQNRLLSRACLTPKKVFGIREIGCPILK